MALIGWSTIAQGEDSSVKSLWELKATTINGIEVPLASYGGSVALVVNTASQCGFTPQYAELEELYEKYKGRGFVVLGFPSNDFFGQEPGTNSDIKKFSEENYKITFPMFAKAPVSGSDKQPVYKFLVDGSGYSGVLWNFEKFLVNREGHVVDRWRSITTPMSEGIVKKVEETLGAP